MEKARQSAGFLLSVALVFIVSLGVQAAQNGCGRNGYEYDRVWRSKQTTDSFVEFRWR